MLMRVLWLTLASFAMRGVSMLFQVYLSGQVGPAGLGLLQLIMTVHGFAVTVGTSGIRVGAMYLSAEEFGHRRPDGVRAAMVRCICAGLLVSIPAGLVLTLSAEAVALHWIKDLQALPSLQLLGLTLPLTCLNAILCGYFTACGKIRKLVAVEIADRIATVVLTASLLQRGDPSDLSHACVCIVSGGALAGLASTAVLLAFLWWDLRRFPKREDPHGMTRRLVRFCVPVALNDYLRSGLGTVEQFLIPYGLARCGGSRAQAMADYGTIQGMVFPVLMFLSTVLYSVADLLVPRLARCRATGDINTLRQITARCLRASFLFSAAVGGLIFVAAAPLGQLLYDSSSAGTYLRLFAPLLPVLYLDCIVDGMHKGLGEQIYCVRINTLTNLLDVIGLYLLLPRLGIGGYLLTYAATHILNFFLSFQRLMKRTGVVPQLSFLLPASLSICAAAGFVLRFAPSEIRWSSLLVRCGIYLLLVSLLWMLTVCNGKNTISKYKAPA